MSSSVATTASAVASPKAAHYNTSLTAALLRGAWADAKPGQDPKSNDLSWGELVRKWGKHTGGNTSLVHHIRDISLLYLSSTSHPNTSSSGFISVPPPPAAASPRVGSSPTTGTIDQAPGSSNSSAGSGSQGTTTSSFVHVPHPHLRHKHKNSNSLDLTQTGSGSTIRGANDSISAGTSRAAYLSAGDLDGDDSDDTSAWGEGGQWWQGVGQDAVDEVTEGAKALEGLIANGKLSAAELTSARLTLAYYLHALGSHEAALKIYDSIDWTAESRSGVVQGDAAVAERIRARCLQGLSAELLPTPNPSYALQSYLATIPLLRSLSHLTIPTPNYLLTQPTTSKISFDPHREIFRHLSTALTRAAVISAKHSGNVQQTLQILRTYHLYSSSWPATFRPIQRQKLLMLYLRALIASHPPFGAAPPEPILIDGGSSNLSARALWKKEAVDAIRQGRALLAATTSFPRAGSVNVPVRTFTELTVALYGQSADLAREVISVLWWAMTLTFQSQSLLRHLTHLLSDVGDSSDARRVFELYVQLVLKSRETQQPEISLQLKRRPTDDDAAHPDEIKRDAVGAGPEAEEKRAQISETEIDGDEEFVRTLLGGARLYCRDLGEADEAWRYTSLAGDVAGQRRVGDGLRARVEEAKGIVRMAMSAHGVESLERPRYQAQAINHLIASTTINPTPSAYYHLSYCQAEARSIESAIDSIRTSLEMDSRNLQAWHLLALLLTARRDWEGATKACEAGVSIWEEDEELLAGEDGFGGADVVLDPNVEARDFAVIPPTPSIAQPPETLQSRPLLHQDGCFPHLDVTPPHTTPLSRSARLEHVIRLRMTLNVVVEKTQGPEAAMLKQQELFAFFSARSGKNRDNLGYSAGFGKGGGMKSVASSNSLAAMGSVAGGEDGGRGLGGSFISVGMTEGGNSTHPLTPNPPNTNAASLEKPSLVIQSSGSSPGNSSPDQGNSDADDHGVARTQSTRGKGLSKHLHVPGGGGSQSRPASVRRMAAGGTSADTVTGRNRIASTSSAALSFAPTAVHSHFRNAPSSHTVLPPPPQTSPEDHGRTPAESRILSNLWLMSAATFRRWGKSEQCLVAIEEAEVLDPENADVWVQLGLYHAQPTSGPNPHANHSASDATPTTSTQTSSSSISEESLKSAEAAFVKSLLLKPDHPSAIIGLSKLYIQNQQVDLAESLLNQLTQEAGWDVPEGWYWLGKVSELQGRKERARECWIFALGLEEGRGVRGWGEVGRWL
ncbi:hypothetical protein CI109_106918 [Kwoniella shandongensis]|uniref:Uncharacterized protein n=1 Tax=Kwoniella shandongensis TaxID=1734106 RepID=A0A5M6C685_9TREE|nr:uncharacterized protein CI109_000827 [Kwoniella shandongensis]KAA5530647.1 hypothetical protein CI109_000827 [Kwoniella shandongensis]